MSCIQTCGSESVQMLAKTGICCTFVQAPCCRGNIEIKAPHIQGFRTGMRWEVSFEPQLLQRLGKEPLVPTHQTANCSCIFTCCTLSSMFPGSQSLSSIVRTTVTSLTTESFIIRIRRTFIHSIFSTPTTKTALTSGQCLLTGNLQSTDFKDCLLNKQINLTEMHST